MGRSRKYFELERNASLSVSYHCIEYRGTNDYARPISVVTLERSEVVKIYYAPSSLMKNRSEKYFIKYEGIQTSVKGYEYPVLKFAK